MVTINIIIRINERKMFFPKLAKKRVSKILGLKKNIDDGFAEMGVGASF